MYLFGPVISVLASAIYLTIPVIADDGAIRVDVTPSGINYGHIPFLVIVTGIAVLFLCLAIIFTRRAPRAHTPNTQKSAVHATSLRFDRNKHNVKDEDYYSQVFKKPVVEIADEKATTSEALLKMGGIEKHLKEDERIVWNVLKLKNNSCSQGTLRVVTDFSKAKLSRTLTEMELRGIVYKQRIGRKNIVTLKA